MRQVYQSLRHAVEHGFHWHCNRLSKHLLSADPRTKIYHGKAVPKSMLRIDFFNMSACGPWRYTNEKVAYAKNYGS